MNTIVIKVWHGLVSEVYSDDPDTEVFIVDEDCAETAGSPETRLPEHRVY